MIAMTEIKRYTPVPPISAADDPTDPLGVAQMTERLKSLAEKDDYVNSVADVKFYQIPHRSVVKVKGFGGLSPPAPI